GPANPELAARLLAMDARGHAALGESAAAARLLLRAEQALDQAPAAERSEWVSRFDEASLAGEAARCLRRLGQLGDARRQAERVIALRPGDRARSRAFGQLVLAQVLIQQRQLDEACAVGRQILDGTAALSSFLVVRQLQRLRKLLAADQSAPAVAAARREVREELGLTLAIGRLLCVDWVSPHGPWDDTLMFVFDGGVPTAAEIDNLRLVDDELAAFKFCTEEQAAQLLRPYVWQRTRAALEALRSRQAYYLQDGRRTEVIAERLSQQGTAQS
ncbi:MAG TPA: NUDIX hydrolase, partial [Streptosporangiaceae bacterium]